MDWHGWLPGRRRADQVWWLGGVVLLAIKKASTRRLNFVELTYGTSLE